jgi:RNA polymerase sigma-70 factor (ECF subfamily)
MGTPAVERERTEELYREHGAAVATLCRSLLRDRGEAEDATQQVFLSAHRALLNGAVPREPLAWLLAVARNECYARFRGRSATPVPTGEAPDGATADASEHVLRAGELAGMWDEVGRMPAAQREAFLLREIRGLSYGQVADALSLSRPSVRSLLLRARTRLRRRLADVTLGGAPWLQTLFRLGDGSSPVPAATKAAAVGLGALALAGAGDAPRLVHHASTAPRPAVARDHAAAHAHRLATAPAAVPVVARHEDLRREDRSGSVGSHEGGHESGDDTALAAPVSQPTVSSDGHDGGGDSSRGGPGPSPTVITTVAATTTVTSGDGGGGSDGGSSGSDSGSSGGGVVDVSGGHDGGGEGG